jgi:hypothetical protein
VTFHELRHTYASVLVNRGCALSVVADLLGHSSIKMVEKHYGHLSRSTVRDELLRAMPRLGIFRQAENQTTPQMTQMGTSGQSHRQMPLPADMVVHRPAMQPHSPSAPIHSVWLTLSGAGMHWEAQMML